MSILAISAYTSANILAPNHNAPAFPEVTPRRGILAVEPDLAVLNAKSLLLTKANYCVTKATSDLEIFALRGTKALALAILSDRLGPRHLRTVAETVRRQWPRTRILILGQAATTLADYLYDEQIDRSSDPQQILDDLESLYRGMWNQRSNTLDWDATKSARCFARSPIVESDPTKTFQPAPLEELSLRGRPADMRLPATRHH
jgi:hypothetical protein